MVKKIVISLISTIFLFYGCKKEEVSSVENTNSTEMNTQEKISDIDILSEDGIVIQNAKAPEAEGENTDLIQKVEKNNTNADIDSFFKAVINAKDNSSLDNYINQGIDINAINSYGENALRTAITAGNMFSLKYLIEKGANINNASDDGIPPLSQAIAAENYDAVDMLLSQENLDMYFVWGDVWTGSPVYMCISKADIYTFEEMIKKGLDINHDFSEYGAPPVMVYAVSQRKHLKLEDYKEIISFLILAKANINARDSKGATPLMLALKNTDIEGFNALIVGRADTKIKDNAGKTALDYYNEYVKPDSEIFDEDKQKIEAYLK